MPEQKKPVKARDLGVGRGRVLVNKAANVATVGCIGSFLIALLNVTCKNHQDLKSILIVLVPAVSVILAEIFKWLWDAIAPSNGLQIRTRRQLNRKSKEIERQLKNTGISEATRLKLQAELDKVVEGVVESYDIQ